MGAPKGSKNALGNKGGGRKTEFRQIFVKQVYGLALLGLTELQMAECFGVSEKTFQEWKKKYVKFSTALKKGKDPADAEIVSSLRKSALGYKYQEVTYELVSPAEFNEKGEEIKKPEYKKRITTKEVPPNPTAARYWLNNRQKKIWKDRHEVAFDPDSSEFEIRIGKKRISPDGKK